MTPEAFTAWLDAMKSAGLANTQKAAADLLGVDQDTVGRMIKRGTMDLRTDLACQALLHGLEPFDHSA